jgi:leucyl aminopeptidase
VTHSLVDRPRAKAAPVAIWPLRPSDLEAGLAALGPSQAAWARTNRFAAKQGETLLVPDGEGALACVLLGLGNGDAGAPDRLVAGKLPGLLPEGIYRFAGAIPEPQLTALAWALGAYRFDRYHKSAGADCRLETPDGADGPEVRLIADGVALARDLINTPSNDMGPDELEAAAAKLARRHKAKIAVIKGNELLKRNFPMIHAVGRASTRAPRLIDMAWGRTGDPKVTLVGKGVCFDTGGLNIKPGNSMALMKKDMGGAANVLGLASMIMAARLKVRLRVLIPAVENSISGNAFRPGDVLASRKGITVEIGNTDAEGRLVLGDALALADEERPDLLIDMATLTGAARVALGPDLPPFYTDDEPLAAAIAANAEAVADPVWRMPLWSPYDTMLESRIADVSHISDGTFAGSITAALFLRRFVDNARAWAHFDIFAWTPKARPGRPVGGEAQAIRALHALIAERYPR